MDSSNAVQWSRMLKYVQSMVEKFYDEVNSNIGIGIITYGDTAKVTTPLNSLSGPSYSRRDILRLIGETPQQGGSSAGFSQAMQLVTGFFSPQQGGRVGVRQVTTLRKIESMRTLQAAKNEDASPFSRAGALMALGFTTWRMQCTHALD